MPGLLRGMARTAAVVGTANAVSHKQQQRWAGQQQEQIAQQQTQYAPPVMPAQDDTAVQLQQLAALRDQGILTEAEFTAKKQQILGL
ncbi:MAG: SHOCT domain-containing protein [Patescibacteria group bacterium]|jgi:hypothetical protein|nr:SHOCT domain-containing protein [Patescibacteria group bacterium]